MGVGPSLAAIEAAKVTQIVAATTLASKRKPAGKEGSSVNQDSKRALSRLKTLAILEESAQLQIFDAWR